MLNYTACSYVCHSKCLLNVNVTCANPLLKPAGFQEEATKNDAELYGKSDEALPLTGSYKIGVGLFGCDLAPRCEMEKRRVPLIIERCIEEVEKSGLDFEGIYRKSGGVTALKAICDSFEEGRDMDLLANGGPESIYAVTSALKQYLRNLPNPLLTYDLYMPLIDLCSKEPTVDSVPTFQSILHRLPQAHYDCLVTLMLHLSNVANMSSVNLVRDPLIYKKTDVLDAFQKPRRCFCSYNYAG